MQREVKALGQIRLYLACPVHPVQLPRYDERGVEIPFPRRTVYVKTEGGNPDAIGMAAAAGAD